MTVRYTFEDINLGVPVNDLTEIVSMNVPDEALVKNSMVIVEVTIAIRMIQRANRWYIEFDWGFDSDPIAEEGWRRYTEGGRTSDDDDDRIVVTTYRWVEDVSQVTSGLSLKASVYHAEEDWVFEVESLYATLEFYGGYING